jgi:hypothetical protein
MLQRSSPFLSSRWSKSNAVPSITKSRCTNAVKETSSTEQQPSTELFSAEVKRFKKMNAPKKLLALVIDGCERRSLSQRDILLGFRSLWQMNRTDLCIDFFQHIQNRVDESFRLSDDVIVTLLRSFSSIARTDLVEASVRLGVHTDDRVTVENENIDCRCSSSVMVELAAALAQNGEVDKAVQYLEILMQRGFTIENDISKKIMTSVMKKGKFDNIRLALLRLLMVEALNDNDSVQIFSNAFMKNLTFVKGSVSMETLPPGKNIYMSYDTQPLIGCLYNKCVM